MKRAFPRKSEDEKQRGNQRRMDLARNVAKSSKDERPHSPEIDPAWYRKQWGWPSIDRSKDVEAVEAAFRQPVMSPETRKRYMALIRKEREILLEKRRYLAVTSGFLPVSREGRERMPDYLTPMELTERMVSRKKATATVSNI